MVNPTKLTVTKLSKLQKMILTKLIERPLSQNWLAMEVADEYEGSGKREGRMISNYYEWGAEDYKPIFSNVFKASFYRSLRRLRDRDLIERWGSHWWDDISNIWRHDTKIQLTLLGKKVAAHMHTNDLEEAPSEGVDTGNIKPRGNTQNIAVGACVENIGEG